MHYSNKSAYTNVYKQKLIKKSEKIKILIATHCFFDSPHSYGKNIFPDFEFTSFVDGIRETYNILKNNY